MPTNHIPPLVRHPRPDDLVEIAEEHHMQLTEKEIKVFSELIEEQTALYERLEELPVSTDDQDQVKRSSGYRPAEDHNPHNAIITKCEVIGADDGPLSDYTVGVKDSIAVAGIEMTCGSKLLEGYVPTRDATVVKWLLEAGADVTAKTNMEDLAWSGSGELSAFGPVTNPFDPEYLAGGSSGGSAAMVAAGVVDIGLGTDQGGSVRMPAAWCGIVGLKPTHGLVPYTGTVPVDPTIDHLGPFTRNVTDCARVLDVIADQDGLDPRQPSFESQHYTAALQEDLDPTELTIGILTEGFDREESEEAVDETVHTTLDILADEGATVRDISVDLHCDADAILTGVAMEGSAALARNDGVMHFTDGLYDPELAIAFGRGRRTNADDYPPMMKFAVLLGQYLANEYQGRYYAKAQNLVRDLRAAYDEVLSEVDVLALPTTPHTAHEVKEEAGLRTVIERSLSMNNNTSPFNGSGHPAISVPCGTANGLPVGLMLVGDRFDDATVLQVAKIVEEVVDFEK